MERTRVCKPWEHLWMAEEIVKNASNWNLAADIGLLKHLEHFSEDLMKEANATNSNLNNLMQNLTNATISLDIARNEFFSLSNKQFIESRVYEDDEILLVGTNGQITDIDEKKQNEEDCVNDMKLSLMMGVDVLNKYFEKIEVPASDSEDETDSPSFVLRSKDPYLDRPLPYVIGSDEWHEKWHVGLAESSSESEMEEVSDKFSDTNSESDLPVTNHQVRSVSDSGSDVDLSNRPQDEAPIANSTFRDTKKHFFESSSSDEFNSVSAQAPIFESNFAEELATKLVDVIADDIKVPKLDINRRPIQKISAITNFGNLFSNEPPPLDDVDEDLFRSKLSPHGVFSGGDGLFNDFDNNISFWEENKVTVEETVTNLFGDGISATNLKVEGRQEDKGKIDNESKNISLFNDYYADDRYIFNTGNTRKELESLHAIQHAEPRKQLFDEEVPTLHADTTKLKQNAVVGGISVFPREEIKKVFPKEQHSSPTSLENGNVGGMITNIEEVTNKNQQDKMKTNEESIPCCISDDNGNTSVKGLFDQDTNIFDDLFGNFPQRNFSSGIFDSEDNFMTSKSDVSNRQLRSPYLFDNGINEHNDTIPAVPSTKILKSSILNQKANTVVQTTDLFSNDCEESPKASDTKSKSSPHYILFSDDESFEIFPADPKPEMSSLHITEEFAYDDANNQLDAQCCEDFKHKITVTNKIDEIKDTKEISISNSTDSLKKIDCEIGTVVRLFDNDNVENEHNNLVSKNTMLETIKKPNELFTDFDIRDHDLFINTKFKVDELETRQVDDCNFNSLNNEQNVSDVTETTSANSSNKCDILTRNTDHKASKIQSGAEINDNFDVGFANNYPKIISSEITENCKIDTAIKGASDEVQTATFSKPSFTLKENMRENSLKNNDKNFQKLLIEGKYEIQPDFKIADGAPNSSQLSNINLFDSTPPPDLGNWDTKSENNLYEDDIYSYENIPSLNDRGSNVFDIEPPSLFFKESSGVVRDQSARIEADKSSFFPYASSSKHLSTDVSHEDDRFFITKMKNTPNLFDNITEISLGQPDKSYIVPLNETLSDKINDLFLEATTIENYESNQIDTSNGDSNVEIMTENVINLTAEKLDKKPSLVLEVEPDVIGQSCNNIKEGREQKSCPGKVKHNLNINVRALLPGVTLPRQSLEKSKSLDLSQDFNNQKKEAPNNNSIPPKKTEASHSVNSLYSGDDPVEVLQNITKDRVRILTKRRPSTKKGRAAIRKSCIDFSALHTEEVNQKSKPEIEYVTANVSQNLIHSEHIAERSTIQPSSTSPDSPNAETKSVKIMDALNNSVQDKQHKQSGIVTTSNLFSSNKNDKTQSKYDTQNFLTADQDGVFMGLRRTSFVKTDNFESPDFKKSDLFDDEDNGEDMFSTKKLPPKSDMFRRSLFDDDEDDDDDSENIFGTTSSAVTARTSGERKSDVSRRPKSCITKKLENAKVTFDPLDALKK